MIRSVSLRSPVVSFALALAAVYGAALAVVSRLAQLPDPALIAGALTVDLTVVVPLLYYMLLARRRGWPAVTTLPVFLASIGLAHALIPSAQEHVLRPLGVAAAAAEIVLAGVVVHKVYRLRRAYEERKAGGFDVVSALRDSASRVLGKVAGGALAYELAVFHYASAGWRRTPPESDRSFSYHRSTGYTALAWAIGMVLVVETAAVHALVRLWSPLVAWILTGLSVYAAIWWIGDTQAVRLRPIEVDGSTLKLRLGLRWTIDVPVAEIERVGAPSGGAPPDRESGYLKAVLVGEPNRRVELASEQAAVGPYGLTKKVKVLDLRLDEPDRFDRAVGLGGSPATHR